MKVILILNILFSLVSFANAQEFELDCSTKLTLILYSDNLKMLKDLTLKGPLSYKQKVELKKIQETYQNVAHLTGKGLEERLETLFFGRAYNPLEATGDLYKVINLTPTKTLIILGDVHGHGDRAAIGTIVYHQQLQRIQFDKQVTSIGVLTKLDQEIKFVSPGIVISALIFDKEKGIIDFASAGIPPLLIKRVDGTVERVTVQSVGAVGEDSPFNYRPLAESSRRVQLQPGETIFITTDGIHDANEQTLSDQLASIMKQAKTTQEMKRNLTEAISMQNDDITFFLIRYRP